MTQRGRGTLEVHDSQNPFMQSTYRLDLCSSRKPIEWTKNSADGVHSEDAASEQISSTPVSPGKSSKPDFSFLYARSSDVIGSKVDKNVGPLSTLMDKPAHKMSVKNKHMRREEVRIEAERPKVDVERVLQVYHHAPKQEDPRFTTSSNEYGKQKPSVATFVAERAALPQDFSKSFNGCKPMNSSLNTGMSKSKVHPKLDPIV